MNSNEEARPGDGPWLETDEEREASKALAFALEQYRRVDDDAYCWKWVILALHNALQGFLVLNLQGSDGLGAMTAKSRAAWLEALEADEPHPPLRLMSVLDLLKHAQGNRMNQLVHSKVLSLSKEQEEKLLYLHRLRNRFTHFEPMTWLLAISELPDVVDATLGAIRFLAFETGNVSWLEPELREEVESIITDFRAALNTS